MISFLLPSFHFNTIGLDSLLWSHLPIRSYAIFFSSSSRNCVNLPLFLSPFCVELKPAQHTRPLVIGFSADWSAVRSMLFSYCALQKPSIHLSSSSLLKDLASSVLSLRQEKKSLLSENRIARRDFATRLTCSIMSSL